MSWINKRAPWRSATQCTTDAPWEILNTLWPRMHQEDAHLGEIITVTLKRKCLHFDEIFITGCTGSCQNDNFQCSQWLKFCQNDDIFVSVNVTHWHLNKMATNLQMMFSNAFPWMKIIDSFQFHWNLLLRVQLSISLHWFRWLWWLGGNWASSHDFNQYQPRYMLSH